MPNCLGIYSIRQISGGYQPHLENSRCCSFPSTLPLKPPTVAKNKNAFLGFLPQSWKHPFSISMTMVGRVSTPPFPSYCLFPCRNSANGQLLVWSPVVWILNGSPKMKGIGILRGIPRTAKPPINPNHQLTITWMSQEVTKRLGSLGYKPNISHL